MISLSASDKARDLADIVWKSAALGIFCLGGKPLGVVFCFLLPSYVW